jgi:hypothetical protein
LQISVFPWMTSSISAPIFHSSSVLLLAVRFVRLCLLSLRSDSMCCVWRGASPLFSLAGECSVFSLPGAPSGTQSQDSLSRYRELIFVRCLIPFFLSVAQSHPSRARRQGARARDSSFGFPLQTLLLALLARNFRSDSPAPVDSFIWFDFPLPLIPISLLSPDFASHRISTPVPLSPRNQLHLLVYLPPSSGADFSARTSRTCASLERAVHSHLLQGSSAPGSGLLASIGF